MRILVDEDLPVAAAELLRAGGHEARHVLELGLAGSTDRHLFDTAQAQGALILSADVDFANLLQFPLGRHNGIIVLRFPDHFRRREILDLLSRFLDSMDLSQLRGALVIVEPGAFRIRRS